MNRRDIRAQWIAAGGLVEQRSLMRSETAAFGRTAGSALRAGWLRFEELPTCCGAMSSCARDSFCAERQARCRPVVERFLPTSRSIASSSCAYNPDRRLGDERRFRIIGRKRCKTVHDTLPDAMLHGRLLRSDRHSAAWPRWCTALRTVLPPRRQGAPHRRFRISETKARQRSRRRTLAFSNLRQRSR